MPTKDSLYFKDTPHFEFFGNEKYLCFVQNCYENCQSDNAIAGVDIFAL